MSSNVGGKQFPTVISDLLAFLHDRLKVYLRDQGIRHDVIDACLAMPGNDDLTLLVEPRPRARRLPQNRRRRQPPAGFKRANNILTQAEEKDGVEYSFGPDPHFAETDEERALFAALDAAEAAIAPALEAEDFAAAMAAMARLRAPIDAFFDAIAGQRRQPDRPPQPPEPAVSRIRADLPCRRRPDPDRGLIPHSSVEKSSRESAGAAPSGPARLRQADQARVCCTHDKGLPQCRNTRISPSSPKSPPPRRWRPRAMAGAPNACNG